ncbi:MAG: CBS domain-containing protein [Desulfotomaculaceae bacterium]|nr:CBS domain-containing protein [Desulfotomaculaceae bacterium]
MKDGPRVALRRMKEHGISSIFVLTKERRLTGIVLAEDALQAVEERREGFKDIIIEDVPRVSMDTPVIDVIPLLTETKFPVVVTGDDDKLAGILVKGSVLAGMVRKGDSVA